MELMRGQKQFLAWGGLQPCEHAVRVKGTSAAFELGLVRNQNKALGEGLVPSFDFFGDQGLALQKHVGTKCGKLLQRYTVQVARNQARQRGQTILKEEVDEQGRVVQHILVAG